MVKVLHIVTKLELGGAQKNVLSILETLDKKKYNLFLVSGKEGILVKDALALKGVEVNLIWPLYRQINLFFDLLAIYEIYRYIKKKKIEIVHTHSSKAGILGRWAAKLAGVPVIVHTIHGWEFHQWQNSFLNLLYSSLERITARITTSFVAVSQYDIQAGLKRNIGTQKKYHLIRYGIKKEDFSNIRVDIKSKKEELAFNSGSSVVGMIACFKPQKSPLDFIKVAQRVSKTVPEARFLLVGDGKLRKAIESLIQRSALNSKVILTGWRRDIPRIISLLDIVVLSSLWEGLPLVVLEAMAGAKPIVATSVGGIPELIQDGENGFLVSPRDARSMSEKVVFLLKDKGLSQRFGQRGRELFNSSHFQTDYMISQLDNLYDSLVRKYSLC